VQGPKGDKGNPGPQGPLGPGLAGQIMSAGADVLSSPIKVFTTPALGTFILMQFCTSVVIEIGGSPPFVAYIASLHGSTFGEIPGMRSNVAPSGYIPGPPAPSSYTTYVPGIALPPNEDLICSKAVTSRRGRCVITGILSNP